jgi:hypothetical protein
MPHARQGFPGRADRMIACRSCGAPTASSDGICRDCADAMREERAAALAERCRIHRVRYVEDLPVSALEEDAGRVGAVLMAFADSFPNYRPAGRRHPVER